MINDREITISAAGSRHATKWPAQRLLWSELVQRLQTPVRSTETLAAYLQMPKRQQDDLKDVGGFVGGELREGRRKSGHVLGRDVVTLDLDNIPGGKTADVLTILNLLGCGYAVYSTRKHQPSAPRLRVLVPLARTVSADEYEPICRMLASWITMEWADRTTFEASRLMYWPSCCADSEYVCKHTDLPMLDPDGVLARYEDWRDCSQWPKHPGDQKALTPKAARQQNPLEKTGIVGAFCKIYDVYKAIDTFLPETYTPCDIPGRFTYTGGSTTGGAVVYEDGLFLYSHHATDPAGGQLCNAWDLVRLHLFGDRDDDCKADTPVNRLPSYAAMAELAAADQAVTVILNKERYDAASDAFAEPLPSSGDDNWIGLLRTNSQGLPAKTIDNLLIILEHDPALKGKLAIDDFANRGMALGALPWDPRDSERAWTDNDDAGSQWYFEKRFGITGKEKVMCAISLAGERNRYNRLRDYLTGLAWDGKKRLDTLLVDYLGAEDTPYTRAVTRKSLCAAVARALTPGVKYDYMPIISGPQGIGKSTLLRLLGKDWFSDSLQTFEGKEAAEMLQGVWINEIGELQGMTRSEVNDIKGFLSRSEDLYRVPYGRRTNAFPRRCVFFGTTNDTEYLRDATGNRRFWPVDVAKTEPTKDVFMDLEDEVDQIWAEAVTRWRLGEALFLSGELEAVAREQQEAHRESSTREGMIIEFLKKPVPADWYSRSIAARQIWLGGGEECEELMPRDRICAAEIWCECFQQPLVRMIQRDTREINAILRNLDGWEPAPELPRFGGEYGRQRGFHRNRLDLDFEKPQQIYRGTVGGKHGTVETVKKDRNDKRNT